MATRRGEPFLSHMVPSVTKVQKRNLLSDPIFQQDLFAPATVGAARHAAKDVSLYSGAQSRPSTSSGTTQRRPSSSSSASRGHTQSLRYLDGWLILAESRTACLQARDRLLPVCEELRLQVNFKKSSLIPSQDMTYLGMQIQSVRFIAKLTETRVENLLRIIEEFLSFPGPPAPLWRRLLGHLSSLPLLVKGGMLRMQSLQIRLRSRWDFRDELLYISVSGGSFMVV